MGILGLSKLLGDYAPSSMKENEFKNYFGKNFMNDLHSLNLSFCYFKMKIWLFDHPTPAHGVKQCSKLEKYMVNIKNTLKH